MQKFILFFLGLCLFAACEEMVAVPKPRMFPRVDFPAKSYRAFDKSYCAFTFEYPTYAHIEQDTTFFEEKSKHPCWFNISTPALNARIHCSYSTIKNRAEFDKLVSDAHRMVNEHTIKATYIDEIPVGNSAEKVYGVYFDIEGPVASTTQFFLTDSTKHFLRGSLYFETQARPDSLAPVIDFVRADIQKMMETFKWN